MAFWNWRRGVSSPNDRLARPVFLNKSDAQTTGHVSHLPAFEETVSGTTRNIRANPLRARMRRAFTPSQPVSDLRMFAGRQDLLRSMIRAIETQHLHVVLYGDRGIGKTSTLHVLSELAVRAGYLVCYTSSGENSDFDEIFRSVLSEVPLLYHSDFDPATGEAEGASTFSSMLPATPLSVADVTRIMGKLTGTKLLVILDEFDRCESVGFRRSMAELIKNLSDRSLPVQIIIGGVAGNLAELLEYLPSIRRNIIGLPMPSMTQDELKEIVQIGSSLSGLPYDPDAIALIAENANGSPYLGSLLGQHAGVAALDRSGDTVSQEDVSTAVALALREMELRISTQSLHAIRDVTDPALQSLLFTLASETLTTIGRIKPDDETGNRNRIDRVNLERLDHEHGLIEQFASADGSGYRFRDQSAPLLIWLRGLHHGHGAAPLA